MIKRIEKNDIPKCVEVIAEAFKGVAEEFGITRENAPRYVAYATTADRLLWQLENEERLMCAYFEGGDIIGFYSLLFQKNGECELNNISVMPTHRHRGIGKELLEDAFGNAEKMNCKKMNIGIVEENRILRRWYEQNGFVHIGTKKYDFFPFICGYMVKDLGRKSRLGNQ